MQGLATFAMRGPLQAALVAATVAVLSLLIPPLQILSGATVTLITLRLGLLQGLLVTAIACIGGGILTWLVLGVVSPVLWLALLYWLPLMLLAVILRTSISLALTLQVAAAIGGLAVLAFYLLLGDPTVWWTSLVNEMAVNLNPGGATEQQTVVQLQQTLIELAPLLPGLLISSALALLLLALLLGRWWQSLLYNPGGFRQEFHELRLGKPMALVMLLLLLSSVLLAVPWLVNLTLVLGMIYLLQGIALVHALVAKTGLSKIWLVAFYGLLVFALSQLVMVLGALDAWFDFRNRIKSLSKKS